MFSLTLEASQNTLEDQLEMAVGQNLHLQTMGSVDIPSIFKWNRFIMFIGSPGLGFWGAIVPICPSSCRAIEAGSLTCTVKLGASIFPARKERHSLFNP